jgi:phosphoribosylamine---glycine ligase
MKVLLVGGGAREHIIADSLCKNGASIIVAMHNYNPGILKLSGQSNMLECKETEVSRIAEWANSKKADFAIIGLEDSLGAGISDELGNYDIPTVGPRKEPAKIEMSKLFARDLMKRHNIPGQIEYFATKDISKLEDYIANSDEELVLKPIGLTAGKGVKVMGEHLLSEEEAMKYGREIIEESIGGFNEVLIEEKLYGEEYTIQCFVDGVHVVPMPTVKDYKRAFEGNKGPNTGGMGSYSQADGLLPFLSKEEYQNSVDIIEQVVLALKGEGYEYKGILYGQFMLTNKGIKVIEFNSRFGDPECMNVLSLLKTNFVDVCWDIINGTLGKTKIEFAKKATVCKYIVPKKYGENPLEGRKINLDEENIEKLGARIYFAKVNERNGGLLTTTSRSIGIVGIGDTIEEAENIAEESLSFITGEFSVRHDIGKTELINSEIRNIHNLKSASESIPVANIS